MYDYMELHAHLPRYLIVLYLHLPVEVMLIVTIWFMYVYLSVFLIVTSAM